MNKKFPIFGPQTFSAQHHLSVLITTCPWTPGASWRARPEHDDTKKLLERLSVTLYRSRPIRLMATRKWVERLSGPYYDGRKGSLLYRDCRTAAGTSRDKRNLAPIIDPVLLRHIDYRYSDGRKHGELSGKISAIKMVSRLLFVMAPFMCVI